jgi:sugar O-acyltransferase (sialic acid O-acetyltransferase NeuD family)
MTEEKYILIVGGSAGSKIATNIFGLIYPYHKIFYCECYAKEIQNNILYATVEQSFDFIKQSNVEYFIATGDNHIRRKHYELIKNNTGKNPLNCIHPSSIVETENLGYGNLICPNAVVHIDSKIGNGTIINTSSVIEHDCNLMDFCQISPNVTLCGYVTIGENSFIGAGSTIIPKINVDKNSTVAAGSVVIKNIPENVMVAGVPSEIKKHII